MDAKFWHQRWEDNEIAFHVNEANPLLVGYFDRLSLAEGARVFLPLCGKTLDIAWLLSKGYRVVGAELIEPAIAQLFSELGMNPEISDLLGRIKRYCGANIDIFVGDIFDLSGDLLGPVDAIYDRAALVALPEDMRRRYTAHLIEITDKAPQLLIAHQYDQNAMDGPPFSISDEEIEAHYRDHYDLAKLASIEVAGGLKGKCPARENVWLLQNA